MLGGADLVIADRAAKLGYPVVRLGVSPAVSAPTLNSQVLPGPARRLMLNPTLIDGTEAHRLGMVHVLVDQAADVLPSALARAQDLASKPPEALAATRAWLREVEAATSGPSTTSVDAALATSLSLAGGPEERQLLYTQTKSNPKRTEV